MSRARMLRISWCALPATLALLIAGPAAGASASPEWRLEQPNPPTGSETPVALGHVGDIEFLEPNLGLLITAGNGQPVPGGVWAYNGAGWHELSQVCGASSGRIAWAGPEEFWTVSDGRPGQAANAQNQLPPLEDNTLCHFARERNSAGSPTSELKVLTSYAALAFTASSYQAMDAAACAAATDCWFGGAPLPAPQVGAFQLHWNGSSVVPEPNSNAEAVGDMAVLNGQLDESVGLPLAAPSGGVTTEEALHPHVIYEATPEGSASPFKGVRPLSAKGELLPEYACKAFPAALGPMKLASGEGSLWAAAGPRTEPPTGSAPAKLTVLHDSGGIWSQVVGPEDPPAGAKPGECPEGKESLKVVPEQLENDGVSSIAVEPGSGSAWIALAVPGESSSTSPAHILHVTASGAITEEELPTKAQREAGIAPLGAATKITCPAQNDCWLVTTQGWLFHLSEAGQERLPVNGDPGIGGPLITFRPADEGVPQIASDTLPPDTSGSEEHTVVPEVIKAAPQTFATVPVALVSHLHARLVHGSTLELTFRIAVRARIKLVALRRKSVVASTPARIYRPGKVRLLLRLNPRRWPTKLDLQTRALAPLPTVSTREGSVESVSTSLVDGGGLGSGPLGRWR